MLFRFHTSRTRIWLSSLSSLHWCLINLFGIGFIVATWYFLSIHPLMIEKAILIDKIFIKKRDLESLLNIQKQFNQMSEKRSQIEKKFLALSDHTLSSGSLFDKTVLIFTGSGLSCKNVSPFIHKKEKLGNIITQNGVKIDAHGSYQSIYESLHEFWLSNKFFLKFLSIKKQDHPSLVLQIVFLTYSNIEKAA